MLLWWHIICRMTKVRLWCFISDNECVVIIRQADVTVVKQVTVSEYLVYGAVNITFVHLWLQTEADKPLLQPCTADD